MKKLLAIALLLVSVLATDAFARGRCCPPKCPTKCKTRCPKPCKKESWEVDKFGYLEQTCELPNPQTFRPGYSLVKCNVVCHKDPCGGCYDMSDAQSELEQDGYRVIQKGQEASAVAQAAQSHAVMR